MPAPARGASIAEGDNLIIFDYGSNQERIKMQVSKTTPYNTPQEVTPAMNTWMSLDLLIWMEGYMTPN